MPDIPTLRRLTQALALLDAILSSEWQYRYYSFNSRWSPGEEMASMRDGCGDHWFLLFTPAGAALKGFAHESMLARDATFPRRVQQTVPATFASFLSQPAFILDETTFCLWRGGGEPAWNVVPPADGRVAAARDGSAELLGILDGDSQTYLAWAEGYYERQIPAGPVQRIYRHEPLGEELLTALNPELKLAGLEADASEIGYPLAVRP